MYKPERLESDLATFVDKLPILDFSDVAACRIVYDTFRSAATPVLEGVTIEPIAIPNAIAGEADVHFRLIKPAGVEGQVPALIWIHGGGFVLSNAESDDAFCAGLAQNLGIAIANVDYRLSPEVVYPAAVNDCYSVARYVAEHAERLGIDADRLGVGGRSAGGALAAGLALLIRDKQEIRINYQLLDVPMLDDRVETPSAMTFVDVPLFPTENVRLSWEYYLAGMDRTKVPIYAAPARASAEQLAGLPPTFISVMEFDALRDEGMRYASSLMEAGVPVEFHSYRGTFHGSGQISSARVSKKVRADIEWFLRSMLDSSRPGTAAI